MGGPGWENEVADLRALGVSVSSTGYIRKVDLPDLYSALDVYLLTSRVEGGPCTVFEAMACETAVVSTRVGAVPELIVNGVNGYSADVDDSEGLLSAVIELGKFPERRISIGKEGRSTIDKRSWRVALSPLEGVYDELVDHRRTTGVPSARPRWMSDPDKLLGAACAADALLGVYMRARKGSMKTAKAIRMLREMLNGLSFANVVEGASMIRRLPSKESHAPKAEPQLRVK